jgi:hypothetical protein
MAAPGQQRFPAQWPLLTISFLEDRRGTAAIVGNRLAPAQFSQNQLPAASENQNQQPTI